MTFIGGILVGALRLLDRLFPWWADGLTDYDRAFLAGNGATWNPAPEPYDVFDE